MHRLFVCSALLGIVIAAACSDGTSPKSVRHIGQIYRISVPARAASSDSVRVGFFYSTVFCDTGTVLEARPLADSVRFTVTSWSSNRTCPLVPSFPTSVGYIVNPPHPAPLRLIFTEPSGGDSVRLVGQ